MAERTHRIVRAIAIAYAVCAALIGTFLSVVGMLIAGVGHFDPGFGLIVMGVPGVLLLSLSTLSGVGQFGP